MLAIVAYFGFIISWAIAYACAYQLASGMWILGIGVLISSSLFTFGMFISPDSYLHVEGFSAQNIALVTFVISPGLSIILLGGLVLLLQFYKFALKQIFGAEIKKYTDNDKLEHQ